MYVTTAIFLALQYTLCLTIRVPVVWDDNKSEVNNNNQFTIHQFQPQQFASSNQKSIPVEYFQYTAQKPKFAVDIAKFYGVQSPENQYKAYPVKPYTGVSKPELGKHEILDKENNIFQRYQEYTKKKEDVHTVTPSNTSYEIFHPYKLEEPALKGLYQDPVMEKIRSDLAKTKIRLQNYENQAGQADIKKEDYLESPEETDRRKVPERNVLAPYEIHHPQRRPVYYRPPVKNHQREQVLNQKLRHPWHQNHVKVKPIHYRPVKNHLQRLRQQHALKYDDERNEYPQLPPPEKHSEPSEGYDIYEKGKAKFVQLRNNVDEALNEAVQINRPVKEEKLEINDNESDEEISTDEEEDDFVPVKNYAQVRKTETTKHLPQEAAYEDADTLEEIKNAPRLREAIKSTKAQTVYSEEGYEDSAYDHGGEQKHASDHEAHGGFLKQKENSSGKFKIPTFSGNYDDKEGSEHRDEVLDGKEWEDSKKSNEKETELAEYSEDDQEDSDEKENHIHKQKIIENNDDEIDDETNDDSHEDETDKKKREALQIQKLNTGNNSIKSIHDINKREVKTEIPETNLNTTYLSKEDTLTLKSLEHPHKTENLNEKYPYYHINLKAISKDSPLRYAENLKLIPKKSEGGTEFYDSRSKLQCPEVEDEIDPLPEKLKRGGHPDDQEGEDENIESDDGSNSSALEQAPRLRGLGDKIDCFKAKYFGENPLDSPFFNEEIISNPEPVTIPSIDIYKLKWAKEQPTERLKSDEEKNTTPILQETGKINMFTLVDKLYPKQNIKNVYNQTDLKDYVSQKHNINNDKSNSFTLNNFKDQSTTTGAHQQQEGVSKTLNATRKKRAAPFVYEPYKIIRDGQIQDSKKTTTTNNISPLIKQLQSSRVVDKVATSPGKDQIVKRNVGIRNYKDIGKNEREKIKESKGSQPFYDASFVDVNVDQRRGEPRYELRSVNPNDQYSPTENKRSMTMEEYKLHTKSDTNTEAPEKLHNKKRNNRRHKTTTPRPYFDVSKFLPQDETKNKFESNVKTDGPVDSQLHMNENDETEDYSDRNNGNQNAQKNIVTTIEPIPRKKITHTPKTDKPNVEVDLSTTEVPKLNLVTRFRDNYQTEIPLIAKGSETTTNTYNDNRKIRVPKYREKKKKSRKSTLITDTNSYGEGDEDDLSKEEEVDALIGVKHEIDDYLPTYEKEARERDSSSDSHSESDEDDEEDDHNYEVEDENENENDDSDDDDNENNHDDEDEVEEDEDESEEERLKSEVTTTEPTKRTLIQTTEAPLTTTEARSAKLVIEPVVLKKKLEIHKELPVNRSSPNITEYKQDIKEVEIIKEIPSRIRKKPQKNIEALELYKDENLAKDVNKLGGVEVFKEGLDLLNGPKHGGNYRSAEALTTDELPSSTSLRKPNENSSKADVVASQSKTSKLIELQDPYMRRRSDIQRARNNRNKNAKLIELSDVSERPTSRTMHGGNFKSIHDIRRRGGSRNAKIIELEDPRNREDHSTNRHVGNPRSYGSRGGERHQMHGGNYRSAKLVEAVDTKKDNKVQPQPENVTSKDSSINARRNSAILLNSFANAVPVLTTPPAYILDPSKRMYYFVDA